MNELSWELFWYYQWMKAQENLRTCQVKEKDIYSRDLAKAHGQFQMAAAQYWATKGVKR
jgi:hypothetical protein